MNRYERFEALKADLESQFNNLDQPLTYNQLIDTFPYSIGKRSHPGSIPSQFTLEPTSWQYSNFGVPFRVARSLKEAEDQIEASRQMAFLIETERLTGMVNYEESQVDLLSQGIVVFPSPYYTELLGQISKVEPELNVFDQARHIAQRWVILDITQTKIEKQLPQLTIPVSILIDKRLIIG